MKVRLVDEEAYPVYRMLELDSAAGEIVEVPRKTVSGWKKVMKEYERVQLEMERLVDEKVSALPQNISENERGLNG